MTFIDSGRRLRYRRCMWYEFRRDLTDDALTETDSMMVPNLALLGLAIFARQNNMPLKMMLQMLAMADPAKVRMFYPLSIDELLFGFVSQLQNPLSKKKMFIQGLSGLSKNASAEYCLQRWNVDQVRPSAHGRRALRMAA